MIEKIYRLIYNWRVHLLWKNKRGTLWHFSGISIQKRDSASEADGGELFKGAAFIAAGVLAASFMTMEIASVLKLGLLAVGVVLCAVGVKWIVKYWKDNKAFEEFVPEWDKGRGMYDRFARN